MGVFKTDTTTYIKFFDNIKLPSKSEIHLAKHNYSKLDFIF